MLSAYIVCLLAGGVVLGASVFGGHDSGGGDAHMGDTHAGTDHAGHHDWAGRLPFLSLRFWTWGVTFFGLAGVALTLGGTTTSLIPWLAATGGVGSGWGASWALGRLTRDAVGVLPEASSHIGQQYVTVYHLLARLGYRIASITCSPMDAPIPAYVRPAGCGPAEKFFATDV